MTDILPYRTLRVYKQLYSIQVVTPGGVFKKDHVPEEFEGEASLTVEVVHEILLVDAAGRIERVALEVPEAMDENKEVGGGYELNDMPYVTPDYPAGEGGKPPTKLFIKVNSKIDPQNALRADEMVRISGGWPIASSA